MTESFDVKHSTGSYSVKIESGSFEKTLREFAESGAFIVADDFFALQFEEWGIKALFLHATEKMKSLDDMPYVAETMRGAGVNRHTELVAVGGGVIQDIVCFIASVYMRGVKWNYIPATVLAMVDSCIGGKSSINVGPYKNLVGTFHPPKQIFIDPDVTKTLPQIEVVSGLIEAIKICYCIGNTPLDDVSDLETIISKSLRVKKWFVETDEFDMKERLLLNFGHTFGHAIESATNFAIPHGIAVGIGILCAIEYSGFRPVRVVKLEKHVLGLLAGLPIPSLNHVNIIERFRSDKKHGQDYFTMILLNPNGDVELHKTERSEQVISDLERVIDVVDSRVRKFTDEYWIVASIGR